MKLNSYFLTGIFVLSALFSNSSYPKSENSHDSNVPHYRLERHLTDLEFEIIYEATYRYDRGKSFFVMVKNLDITTASFKNEIKETIKKIVAAKGGKISIEFFRERRALDLAYQEQVNNKILSRSDLEYIGENLVATFSGQLKNNIYFNTLDFFPGTFTSHPRVGKYVETVEFNPG